MWRTSTDWVGGNGPDPQFTPSGRVADDRRSDVLRGARILVVEDEMLVAALLEDRLIDLGCAVVGPAARVNEALALLQTEPVDAAVLDVNIAGELIFPVADALEGRKIPFIFATAYGAGGLVDRHSRRAVLDKPYQERALAHALRAALLSSGAH